MSSKVKINFDISSTDVSQTLGAEVWLDQQQLLNVDHVDQTIHFEHEFNDDEAEHVLKIQLKNKLPEHTKISETGEILSDVRLVVDRVEFEEIEINQLFQTLAVYEHDFNGTQPAIRDQFFGEMGCNGTLSLTFRTPVYLWLLENM